MDSIDLTGAPQIDKKKKFETMLSYTRTTVESSFEEGIDTAIEEACKGLEQGKVSIENFELIKKYLEDMFNEDKRLYKQDSPNMTQEENAVCVNLLLEQEIFFKEKIAVVDKCINSCNKAYENIQNGQTVEIDKLFDFVDTRSIVKSKESSQSKADEEVVEHENSDDPTTDQKTFAYIVQQLRTIARIGYFNK